MCFKTIVRVVVLLLLLIGAAIGQTITVDIASDDIDIDPGTATVTDLPGPDGHISFSEAMIASNNTPGRQTIGFAIPPSEWTYLNWYLPGRAVVHTLVGFYWRAYDEVTIDGTTQTAFTGDTNPDGWEVVLWGGGAVYLNADNCTVVGLDNTSVSVTGSNGRVEGNTAMGIELFGGSGSLVKDNTGGYIQIDRSNDNVVVGNTCNRVRVLGWVGGGQPAINNRIGGSTPAERNFIIGLGTWNSEGFPGGFAVQIFDAMGTVIENNQIGTTVDGMEQGNLATTSGISLDGENYETTIRDNRIAGILGRGIGPHFFGRVGTAISVYGTGSGVSIVGNKIGLNANDEPLLGSVTGISMSNYYLGPVQNVVIGGLAEGDGNVIAGHLLPGISVANTFSDARISGNSIHDNGGLGIDLITDGFLTGVTPNDPLDTDTGANGLQNFPEILLATNNGQAIHVVGQLHSEPLKDYTLEFFASPACDPSGFGQGQMFLGSIGTATDPEGNASFDVSLPVAVSAGWVISSTATLEPTGATSEFSECMPIGGETFADSFEITHGDLMSGSIADLMASDDSDLTVRRNSGDLSSRVFIEFSGVSPTLTPSAFALLLEGSVFARSEVVQSIDFYDYNTDSWEEVASSSASRFSDSTKIANASGDMTRFVQAGTNQILARCRFESANARQQFSASVDKIAWMIAN